MAKRKWESHPPGLYETEVVAEEEDGNAGLARKLDSYLEVAAECTETLEKMVLRNFNNEQCGYLVDKLKVVIQTASLFVEAEALRHGSFVDIARHVETFKLLVALANQIVSFVQDCCRDAWIQAAMTWTNVAEHVSLIGSNLELCKVAFFQQLAATQGLSVDQIVNIIDAEVEIVKQKASADVETLLARVTSELNSLKGRERDLATYLLQRLLRVQGNRASFTSTSSFGGAVDDKSFWGRLFQWVKPAERLGKGSAATVHKATWLGMPVAKKTFQGHDNPDFIQEVGILGKLCHPNITSMFCCAKEKRWCAIIMELMDEDLHDLMQRRLDGSNNSYPFPILEALDIMLQIGEGMNYLHNQRIVHRDLKSFNILVKSVKARGVEIEYVHAKVGDFGLSKTKESSVRYSNQTFNTGTNRWMAPEVINLSVGGQGRALEPRYPFKCDVYSFAMVCYEILTGYEPFYEETSPTKIKQKVLKGERPSLPDQCPPLLKALIMKCWTQEPKERPSFAFICSRLKYLKYLSMTDSMQTLDTSASSQATILPGPSSLIIGLGPVTSVTEGMNTGIRHGTIGGGTISASSNTNANSNLVDPTGGFVFKMLGTRMVPIPVTRASKPQTNPLDIMVGIGETTSAFATAGVNAGVDAGVIAIPPSSGLAQPVQTGTIGSAATPTRRPKSAKHYTKLWEGFMAGQRQQKPVPICKLEAFRRTSASEKLAADWPRTILIDRLISQEYMSNKEYRGKAELLIFRPLSQHGFIVQLGEKKLCAVFKLPTQTLLLAPTDKPGRMNGMLFPGAMEFKP